MLLYPSSIMEIMRLLFRLIYVKTYVEKNVTMYFELRNRFLYNIRYGVNCIQDHNHNNLLN